VIPVGTDDRHDPECRGELVARERRGEMSHQDCLALRAHLADCASCRVARQVYVDLDDASGVDVHDGVRIERMSSAARRWAHAASRSSSRRAWPGRRRLRTLGLAAVAVLLGGTASATAWFWEHPGSIDLGGLGALVGLGGRAPGLAARSLRGHDGSRNGPRNDQWAASAAGATAQSEGGLPGGPGEHQGPREQPAEPATPQPFPAGSPSPPGSALAGAASVGPSSDESPVSARRVGHGPARALALTHRTERLAQSDAASRSAAEMLREASNARRSGDAARATRLYRSLQHDFPDSSEAVLSSVALGGLLLEQRSPRSALIEFDAYLGSSRGGELVPEALYGRGRALAALGDRQEERRTWQRLLTDFPGSAYGPWARRRLADPE
jgi:TolA-binding protein